jgi:hypothetical protein
VLAKKMTVLYKLAREQLSKQHHYDFGLRALKSVLVMAGSLKRGSPDMPEALVLMRALRDMNLPKFVFDDVPLFLGLIQDLFPGEPCAGLGWRGAGPAAGQAEQQRHRQLAPALAAQGARAQAACWCTPRPPPACLPAPPPPHPPTPQAWTARACATQSSTTWSRGSWRRAATRC